MPPEPQVSFAIVARNAAGKIIAEIDQAVQGISRNAERGGLNTVFRGFGVGASEARKGANALEGAMRTLAVQATGATGALGQLAKGGLILGGGWGVGIAAGIGIISLAMRALEKDTSDATKRIEDFVKSLRGEEAGALVPGQALTARLAERDQLRGRRAGLQAELAGVVPGSGEDIPIRAQILAIDKELQRVNHDIGLIRGRNREEAEKTAEADERDAAAVERMLEAATNAALKRAPETDLVKRFGLQAQMAGEGVRPGTFGARLLGAQGDFDRRRQLADAKGLGAVVEKLGGAFRAGKLDVDIYAKAIKDAAQAHKDSTAVAIQAIHGLGQLAQSLIRGGGGPGGFISGLGGIVGGLLSVAKGVNPLIGAGVTVGTGLVGALFDRGRDRPVRTHDDGVRAELRQLRQEIKEILVSITIISSTTGEMIEQTEYELGRLTRRDGIVRIPRR